MSIAAVVSLLQTALVLLTLVTGHPELPQSLRDTAAQVAQQAITQAMIALSIPGSSPTSQHPPLVSSVTPNAIPPTVALSNCVDTDGGKDMYTKGEARSFFGAKTLYVGSDTCATPYDGPAKYTTGLPSCSADDCYVEESYCSNYKESLIPQHEFIKCSHGCTAGACIK